VLKAVILTLTEHWLILLTFTQSWQRTFNTLVIRFLMSRYASRSVKEPVDAGLFSLEELDESDDGLGPTFGERMREYRRELYKREYHPRVKLFLKCVSCRIKADGKRIALASSATKADLATYQQILNVEDLVDAATTTGGASKPEPDIFKVTLDKLGDIDPGMSLLSAIHPMTQRLQAR